MGIKDKDVFQIQDLCTSTRTQPAACFMPIFSNKLLSGVKSNEKTLPKVYGRYQATCVNSTLCRYSEQPSQTHRRVLAATSMHH